MDQKDHATVCIANSGSTKTKNALILKMNQWLLQDIDIIWFNFDQSGFPSDSPLKKKQHMVLNFFKNERR